MAKSIYFPERDIPQGWENVRFNAEKLDDDAVRFIRAARATRKRKVLYTQAELAARYGVSIACISNIQRGKTYRHVKSRTNTKRRYYRDE